MSAQQSRTQTPDDPCQECTFMDKEGNPMDCAQCTQWYLDYEHYRKALEGGLAERGPDIRKEGPKEPPFLSTSKISIPGRGRDF